MPSSMPQVHDELVPEGTGASQAVGIATAPAAPAVCVTNADRARALYIAPCNVKQGDSSTLHSVVLAT